jgi:hypothetical protein
MIIGWYVPAHMARGNEPSSDLAAFTSRAFREAGGWGLVAVGILVGTTTLSMAATSTVVGVVVRLVIAALLVLAGATIAPSLRKRVDHRHSLGSFGRSPVVERRTIRPREHCHERCVVCDASIDAGLVRRYREDITVAGIPLVFGSNSYNHYCLDCARAEMGTRTHGPDSGVRVASVDEQRDPLDEDERDLETESV